VLESLVKVGALNAIGHPAQLLDALDDALAAGQAVQRDRLTGQVSLFDSTPDSTPLERPLRADMPAAPARERLRWEKELLGLYLSDHPLAEHAPAMGQFVNAYSADLGEELDQQRVVVGGIVTETRRVITKARTTMGVVTLEDLQGSVSVIVFPKVLELTEGTWAEDAILAGRRAGRPQG
jgi:DNA polymerase-3 subunit alpha